MECGQWASISPFLVQQAGRNVEPFVHEVTPSLCFFPTSNPTSFECAATAPNLDLTLNSGLLVQIWLPWMEVTKEYPTLGVKIARQMMNETPGVRKHVVLAVAGSTHQHGFSSEGKQGQ